MKGFSIPSISIPSVSIPNISFSGSVDTSSIKNAIESAVPDISSLTDGIDLKGTASDLLSENTSSVDLSELSGYLK
jgi:hypothetical protein